MGVGVGVVERVADELVGEVARVAGREVVLEEGVGVLDTMMVDVANVGAREL